MTTTKYTFQKRIALYSLVLGLTCVHSLAFANESYSYCHSAYQKWLSAYGSSDPYLAVQKTTPWPLLPDVLAQLHRNEVEVSESNLAAFGFATEALKQQAKASFLSTLKDIGPLSSRDLAIRQNLKSFLDANRSSKNELSMAYVGLAHGIDLFLAHPQIGATYVNKPFSLTTPAISKGRRELQDHLRMPSPPTTVGDAAFSYYVLPYVFTAQTLRSSQNARLPKNSFIQRASDENRIVISELHGFDSTRWIADLPKAECLKSMGITKINLALEGYATGRTFTTQNVLDRRTYIEQFNYRANKIGISIDELMTRLKFPAPLRGKIRSGSIEDNPAIPALIRRLVEYRSKGIVLNLQGLESATYNELEAN